jgi:AcrR family transcriptional regulator
MLGIMKATRPYTQRARARATAETRTRILDAALACVGERLSTRLGLADVAERAGVSVQTVLRHFGSKEELLEETRRSVVVQVQQERSAPPGDVTAGLTAIVEFYEHRGDWSVRMLAEEDEDPDVARHVALGRAVHREWAAELFAPQLATADDPVALLDLLVVATDVYTWKILRRDRGHDQDTTRELMLHLVRALLPAPPEGHPR